MEAIRLDLREETDGTEMLESHKHLLDARRERAASGKVVIREWDSVKDEIGRR